MSHVPIRWSEEKVGRKSCQQGSPSSPWNTRRSEASEVTRRCIGGDGDVECGSWLRAKFNGGSDGLALGKEEGRSEGDIGAECLKAGNGGIQS